VPPSGLKIDFSVSIRFQIERLIIKHFIFLTNLKGYQCIFFGPLTKNNEFSSAIAYCAVLGKCYTGDAMFSENLYFSF